MCADLSTSEVAKLMSREQLREDYLALSEYNKGFLHGWHCAECKHLGQSNPEWDRGFSDGTQAKGTKRPWNYFKESA